MMSESKQRLREQCLARRKALSSEQKETFSNEIIRQLQQYLDQHYVQGAEVLCYRSLADEVNTTSVFMEPSKHQWYAPVTQKNGDMHWLSCHSSTTWEVGSFRVLEPVEGQCWKVGATPAIVLCPVVGFDGQGNRIGMGKGCFDRWLAKHRQHIDMVIGIGFECQRCSDIEYEVHDVPLDAIITEQGWMTCPNI